MATATDTATVPICHNNGCNNRGVFRCTQCRDAEPPTLCCSNECQRMMWPTHVQYCGKKAYTFDLTLLDTSDPVIKRTFDVPAWFTFKQLHCSIQHVMAYWQHCHLHDFVFAKPPSATSPFAADSLDEAGGEVPESDPFFHDPTDNLLTIGPSEEGDSEDGWGPRPVPEDSIKLEDVLSPSGHLNLLVRVPASEAGMLGPVYPLYYLYDLGDNWYHELVFKGEKAARAARPIVTFAQGCCPVEDSGGWPGWKDVKEAFAAASPTRQQRERKKWARRVSGLGSAFDPTRDPDLNELNSQSQWEMQT